MKNDRQRATKKDAVFDNLKILNGNQIPLSDSLAGQLPIRGSLLGLKSGNIHDLYYADGLQWIPITDGGSTADPPLDEVLTSGNATGGTNIEVTDGDAIVSETDGTVLIQGIGTSSVISLDSEGQTSLLSSKDAPDAIRINASNSGGIDIDADGQIDLTSTLGDIDLTSTLGDINITATSETEGRISINGGFNGIALDADGDISLTSLSDTANAVSINTPNGGISASTSESILLECEHVTISDTGGGGSPNDGSHLHSKQTELPTLTTDGTGASVRSGSTDMAGVFIYDPDGSKPATIFFSKPYPTANLAITLTPEEGNAAAAQVYIQTPLKNTDFSIKPSTDTFGGCIFHYHVIHLG